MNVQLDYGGDIVGTTRGAGGWETRCAPAQISGKRLSRALQSEMRNRLLRALPAADFDRLAGGIEAVELPVRTVIQPVDTPFEFVTFPGSGIASIVAVTSDDRRLEVGLYGRDGMSGQLLMLGGDRSPHEHFMQVAGAGHRVRARELEAVVEESRASRLLLLRYVLSFTLQVAGTALSNGAYTVEERLARWLLMSDDRLDGEEMALTHEFLALMLGVRRSSVTVALQVFEGAKLIHARRGHVRLLDRAKLAEIAGDSYGGPEAEHQRLLGTPI